MDFNENGKEKWEESLKVNGNSLYDYGGCVLWFAERWADAMEEEIKKGEKIEDIAKPLESKLLKEMDRYSLTGFQYGCAVGILASCWKYGDELRRWHNLRTQIGNEGEKANEEEGAVLNPALLCIGSK